MQPDISIITPWLDHPEFIEDYEKAVADPAVEVIAVDNGSSAGAAAQISAMVKRLAGKYIRNEENHWFAFANNQGLAVARGAIVLFMNNDIAGQAGWLDQVRKDVQPGGLFGPTASRVNIDKLAVEYLEGWCIAGRRDVWMRLGGWNARSFQMPYWEDTELCIRAIQGGIRLVQTNWPVTHKKNGTSSFVPGVLCGLERNRQIIRSLVHGQTSRGAMSAAAVDPAHPEPVESYLETARLPQAEVAFREAVAREPNRAELWLIYGQILRNCGRFEAAITAMKRATELYPANAALAHFEIGLSLLHCQRHVEAADEFAQAVALKGDLLTGWLNLAIASSLSQQLDRALDASKRAITLDPRNPSGHVQLSNALLRLGRKDEARAAADQAIRVDPNAPSGYHALGSALLEMNEPQEALEALDKAMTLDPHNWDAHVQREKARAILKQK
jgi:Flp pilus assembly protein TadD